MRLKQSAKDIRWVYFDAMVVVGQLNRVRGRLETLFADVKQNEVIIEQVSTTLTVVRYE